MFKKVLLLSTLFLATGCVERGYQLTINDTTQTVTAVKSIDIRKEKSDTTQKNIDKMNKAVTKVQKQQSKKSTQLKKDLAKKKHLKEQRLAEQKKFLEEKKHLNEKKLQEEEEKKATEAKIKKDEEKRVALHNKLAKEEEKKRLNAEKERILLAKKSEAQRLIEVKRAKDIQNLKEKKEREAAAKKLAKDEALRKEQEKKEQLALEHKLQKEKEAQVLREKKKKAELEQKIAQEHKKAQELKRKKELEEKQSQREKQSHKTKNSSLKITESLIFKPSKQTYQKFGTSEIHGHVVYMTPSGQEISLQNTKIYLVPQNTKTTYWYNNYYLKNKEASKLSKTVVNYINATHLNLEKNFAFYGLATGVYYIIIESSYPAHIARDKKVYIAKKINVDKYKKIMTVFSKKL